MFDEITNKEVWETKIGSLKMSQFMQSWEWGEFQKSLGRQVWRFVCDDKFVQIIKMPLPLGKFYFYVPRLDFEIDDALLNCLKLFAYKQKGIFLRIEPVSQDLTAFNFKKVKSVQPSQTLLLDLSNSEEQLLAEMHQKTRYNIRLAAKKGVKLATLNHEKFLIFYDLLLDTFRRKGKKLYSREYFQKLMKHNFAKLYFAEYGQKILCANLVVFYGDTATYLYGGSAPEDKNTMAPQLLQWEIMKLAKALGYKYYDLWGIDEKKWPGVTRFKKGFGGFEVKYPGTFDLAINKLDYNLYHLIKIFK